MDFDDLEEAAAARLEEDGEDEAALGTLGAAEEPGLWPGGLLPPMRSKSPSETVLPTTVDMPRYLEAHGVPPGGLFRERTEMVFEARLLVFYGAGDSVPAWLQFMNAAPDWLDVAVFESPGHGFRKSEAIAESVAATAKEAFQVAREVLEQHAKGGCLEGAPFSLVGHSMGVQVMVEVAMLAKKRLGLEPVCLFPIDRGAPHLSVYTPEGYRLLCMDEPQEFMDGFNPQIGKIMQDPARHKPGTDYERQIRMWQKDLQNCQEHVWPLGHHIFRCRIHALAAEDNFDLDKMARDGRLQSMPPEVQRVHDLLKKITSSGEESSAVWSRESFGAWEKWTTGACQVHWIKADHVRIKMHPDTMRLISQEFRAALVHRS